MLKLCNVSFSYGEKAVLKNFSLSVKGGECIALSGASGIGKTTVARLLLGLEKPQSGAVAAPDRISCVFQEDRLISSLNVKKNIQLVLRGKDDGLVDDLLSRFGLSGDAKSRIDSLSGGMKRRVAIIRAIAYAGDALILDEAFNGLDTQNKKIAAEIIKHEFLDKNKPVLMISHIKEDMEMLNARVIEI